MEKTNGEILLEHAGVKGMKWGRRKARVKIKGQSSRAREKSWNKKYKNRSSMSDSDLQRNVNRLRLENDFKRLTKEARGKRSFNAKTFNKAMNSPLVKQGVSSAVSFAMNQAMKKAAGGSSSGRIRKVVN